tara:strand:- start:40 stop:576 length:537 start_codon:yes stop_codon:yes gene_type:complete
MNKQELDQILHDHKLWLQGKGGQRADLRGAYLNRAVLRGAVLRGADLRSAILRDADLRDADLSGANLRCAYLNRADLNRANLSGADLCDAILCDANLRGANLWSTTGNKREVKSLQLEQYDVTYTAEVIQIGCQRHTIEEWANFSRDDIAAMDAEDAVEWWAKWKEDLMNIIQKSPCN